MKKRIGGGRGLLTVSGLLNSNMDVWDRISAELHAQILQESGKIMLDAAKKEILEQRLRGRVRPLSPVTIAEKMRQIGRGGGKGERVIAADAILLRTGTLVRSYEYRVTSFGQPRAGVAGEVKVGIFNKFYQTGVPVAFVALLHEKGFTTHLWRKKSDANFARLARKVPARPVLSYVAKASHVKDAIIEKSRELAQRNLRKLQVQ